MRRKEFKRRTALNIRNIPTDVKAQFKGYCARHGYSMQEAIITLMKYSAKQDITLPGVRSATLTFSKK